MEIDEKMQKLPDKEPNRKVIIFLFLTSAPGTGNSPPLRQDDPKNPFARAVSCFIVLLIDSVGCGKAFAMVIFLLQFVDHRYRIIFDRDEALAFFVEEHIVFTQAIFSGADARSHITEIAGGREEDPIDCFLFHQRIEIKLSQRFHARQPRFGKSAGIDQPHPGFYEKSTGSAYDQQTLYSRTFRPFDDFRVILSVSSY